MNPKAVAVVVAPNLYSPAKDAGPKEIIDETNGVVAILETAVRERVRLRKDKREAASQSTATIPAPANSADANKQEGGE